jgi:hypothetical protein
MLAALAASLPGGGVEWWKASGSSSGEMDEAPVDHDSLEKRDDSEFIGEEEKEPQAEEGEGTARDMVGGRSSW